MKITPENEKYNELTISPDSVKIQNDVPQNSVSKILSTPKAQENTFHKTVIFKRETNAAGENLTLNGTDRLKIANNDNLVTVNHTKGQITNNHSESANSIHPTNEETACVNKKDLYKILRKNLLQGSLHCKLPNTAWSINRNENSGTLVFFYAEEEKNPFNKNKLEPLASKIVSYPKTIYNSYHFHLKF